MGTTSHSSPASQLLSCEMLKTAVSSSTYNLFVVVHLNPVVFVLKLQSIVEYKIFNESEVKQCCEHTNNEGQKVGDENSLCKVIFKATAMDRCSA